MSLFATAKYHNQQSGDLSDTSLFPLKSGTKSISGAFRISKPKRASAAAEMFH
jgi:hypothetical protein